MFWSVQPLKNQQRKADSRTAQEVYRQLKR